MSYDLLMFQWGKDSNRNKKIYKHWNNSAQLKNTIWTFIECSQKSTISSDSLIQSNAVMSKLS